MTPGPPEGAARPALDVLVVEDERAAREILTVLLQALGHRVAACANGREALALCHERDRRFDLILMDVQMPVMDGLEAARRLRADARTRDVAIVCVTARASSAAQEDALRAGCDGYLTKPVHEDRIFQAVTEVLRRRGRLRPDQAFA